MSLSGRGLLRTLLLSALVYATSALSRASKCDPRPMPDMVIDVNSAVGRGARFTDPINAVSMQECVSACCMKMDRAAGDLGCNLVVYDTRKVGHQKNCYLFHCPSATSCPMYPSRGVLSYTLWTENADPDPSEGNMSHALDRMRIPSQEESSAAGTDSDVESRPRDSHPGHSRSQENEVKGSAKEETPAHITSQLLHLADNIDKRLGDIVSKAESDNVHDESLEVLDLSPTAADPETTTRSHYKKIPKLLSNAKGAKSDHGNVKKPAAPEVHYPTPRNQHTVPPVTAGPLPMHPTQPNLMPSSTKDVRGAKKVSSSTKNTMVPSSQHGANKYNMSVGTTPKYMRMGHTMTHTEGPAHRTTSLLLVTQPAPVTVTSSKAAITAPKTGVHPSTKGQDTAPERAFPNTSSPVLLDPPAPAVDLQEVPKNVGSLETFSDDKNGLVAALVFGVVFLLVVIGLVSRKVSEARRRYRYTKLDYLINGMYVDT